MGQDATGIRDILADGRQQQMDLFGYCAWGGGENLLRFCREMRARLRGN